MFGDKNDLTPGSFPPDLNWSHDDAMVSLDRLYTFVNAECDRSINWYFAKKRSKRIYGTAFRVGAILALAVSGLIPIFSEMYNLEGTRPISPAWATVALAFAALFVSLDKFGGYTSGWVRYVRTGQALSQLQSEFRIQWEKQRQKLERDQVDPALVEQAIDLCSGFLDRVNMAVQAETNKWAEEFRQVLADIEKQGKRTGQPPARG